MYLSGGALQISLRILSLNQALRMGNQSFQDSLYTYKITEKYSRAESVIQQEFPLSPGKSYTK